MRKKIILGICTFALAFALTACGSKEEATYGGYTANDFEGNLQNMMTSLESIGEDELDSYISYYESSDDEVTATLLSDWAECYTQKGEFLGYGEFELTKSGKTLTATLVSDYTNRDLKLTYVFNVNHIEDGPTAINIEPVYTMGETMAKAGLNTVMGISIVFIMLVVMSLIISLFKYIPSITSAFKGENQAVSKTETQVSANTTAQSDSTDDLELVAVIAAAIAASTGASTDSFVVRSIKKRR